MAVIEVQVSCPVTRSFRVEQVAGLFDLELTAKTTRRWSIELPGVDGVDADWRIGAIVGPSGSGKSVIARELCRCQSWLFVEGGFEWPTDRAVVDAFGDDTSVRDITGLLNSVGFSSPPDWVKPYSVLSNGQRFRCDLARALLSDSPVVAVDEFTSVVDRQVAKFGSAAVAKTIRKGRAGDRRFIAVSCHYDFLDWLQPDWVLDMASAQLARRWLQPGRQPSRPAISLEIRLAHQSAWSVFVYR